MCSAPLRSEFSVRSRSDCQFLAGARARRQATTTATARESVSQSVRSLCRPRACLFPLRYDAAAPAASSMTTRRDHCVLLHPVAAAARFLAAATAGDPGRARARGRACASRNRESSIRLSRLAECAHGRAGRAKAPNRSSGEGIYRNCESIRASALPHVSLRPFHPSRVIARVIRAIPGARDTPNIRGQ